MASECMVHIFDVVYSYNASYSSNLFRAVVNVIELVYIIYIYLEEKKRPRQDSNLQSSDSKSDALSIRPRGR